MADLSLIEAAQFELDEDFSTFFIPDKFRFMQELWIQVRITERLRETGTIKLDSPIPRIWTGYYYLLADNCVFESGPIEYQNQEIYRGINLSWNAEIAANENSYNLSTPEVPPDIDAVDEASEADLWASDDDENYYLIRQLPIDRVTFLIPRGCKLTINLCGIRFSPLSVFGPDNDINLYEDNDNDGVPDLLKKSPDNPFQFPEIDEGLLISDFDSIARSRGYILASECAQLNLKIFNCILTFEYRLEGQDNWIPLSRLQAIRAIRAPELVGIIIDRSINVGQYFSGSGTCAPTSPTISSSQNFNAFARLSLFDGSEALVRLAGNPSGGNIEIRNVSLATSPC